MICRKFYLNTFLQYFLQYNTFYTTFCTIMIVELYYVKKLNNSILKNDDVHIT